MIYTVPHYYRNFKCTAAACTNTCCAGWTIMIDERAMFRYKSYKGSFGSRLRNSIDWKESSFHQYEGRCAFLNEENLCDIYGEAGQHMLCNTCRNYPRHVEEFEGRRELTLSLSCPEAAKLILGCKEPVRFLTQVTLKEEKYPEFDALLFAKLSVMRDVLISVLQERDVDIKVRMMAVLGLCHDVQTRMDKNHIYEIDKYLARIRSLDIATYCRKKVDVLFSGENSVGEIHSGEPSFEEGRIFYTMRDILEHLSSLEVVQKEWPEYLSGKMQTLYGDGEEIYREYRRLFEKQYLDAAEGEKFHSIWMEQLMVYAVSTYFCGAVYDGLVLSKAKLGLVMTLVIRELCLAFWVEHGGMLSFEDAVEIAHRFSREMEHSDMNLNIVEEMLERESCFEFLELLRVIQL